MKYLILLVLLGGCSNNATLFGDAVRELDQKCSGDMSASVTVTSWTNSATFTCSKLKGQS